MRCIPSVVVQRCSLLPAVILLSMLSLASAPMKPAVTTAGTFVPPSGAVNVPVTNVIFSWPAQGSALTPSHVEDEVVVYDTPPSDVALNRDQSYDVTSIQNTTVFYRLVLSTDADMKDVVLDTRVYGNTYVMPARLDYGRSYFWRVMSVDPAPSEWSDVNIFHTAEAAVPGPAQAEPMAPRYAMLAIGLGLGAIIGIVIYLFLGRFR